MNIVHVPANIVKLEVSTAKNHLEIIIFDAISNNSNFWIMIIQYNSFIVLSEVMV